MNLKEKLKSNPKIKQLVLWMLMPKNQARPRLWVKWFVNPFFHKRGKGSRIRSRSRMDVMPFNSFELGQNSTIEDFTAINNGVGAVRIGDRCRVGLGSVLIGPVELGNDVGLAQHVVMSGLNHSYENIQLPIFKQAVSTKPIVIKDETWIGANVFIAAGITIGRHCVVAGGSVVTKDVPDYSLVAGNPAKIIKQYDAVSNTWIRIQPTKTN